MVWPMIAALLGSGIAAGGSYLGAREQSKAAVDAANMSEKGKAWTQLLGFNMMDQATPAMEQGLGDYLSQMQAAATTTGQLPSVARAGQQKQLGQLAGAESSAMSQVMRNQKSAMGGVGQSAASKGFYGSSIQGGQQNQVRANTNQAMGDIMASFAGRKSDVMGQGTQNIMQGLLAKAQGQQGAATATMNAAQGNYNMMTDRLNHLLATANQYGVTDEAIQAQMANRPEYLGVSGFPPQQNEANNPWYDPTGFYGSVGEFYQDNVFDNIKDLW